MLRQRRKPSAQGRSQKPSFSARKRKPAVQSAFQTASAWLLDVIGIRKLRPDPPLSPHDKSALRLDAALVTLIFVVTLATRFYRLAQPPKIVFDEFHFAAFVDQYNSGRYLFDIHPPLGKLTLTAVAKLAGYQNINYTFDALGKPFGDLVYVPQRAFSALAGSFIPPVMYLTCRTLLFTPLVSLTAAAMPLFDFLLCIESRLILTDSQLILFIQSSFLCAFKLWSTPKSTPKRYLWLCLTAFFGACAISTKWTAMVAPAMIGLVSLMGFLFRTSTSLDLIEMAIAGFIAITLYMSTFWIHFRLLPFSGPGDAFMKIDFQQTLIGNPHYGEYDVATLKPPSFWEAFRYLNWEMLRANSAIEQRHHWESKWYEWLYNARGVLYIDEPEGKGLRQQIYLISNPVLTICTGLGVIISLVLLLRVPFQIRHARRKVGEDLESVDEVGRLKKRGWLISFHWVAWVLNLLPYVGVKRCTFLYHVLPSLQMASMLTAIVLQGLGRKVRVVACVGVMVGLIGAFYWWRAWIYGIPQSIEAHDKLRLMPRWN